MILLILEEIYTHLYDIYVYILPNFIKDETGIHDCNTIYMHIIKIQMIK